MNPDPMCVCCTWHRINTHVNITWSVCNTSGSDPSPMGGDLIMAGKHGGIGRGRDGSMESIEKGRETEKTVGHRKGC